MPLAVLFRLGLPEFATWYMNECIVDPLTAEFGSDEFGPPGGGRLTKGSGKAQG